MWVQVELRLGKSASQAYTLRNMKKLFFAHGRVLGYSILSMLAVLAVSFVVFSRTSVTQAQTVHAQEGDHDEDGNLNSDDVDDDSDGLPDCTEKDWFTHDHDNDGLKDDEDTDDDNDDLLDTNDADQYDTDNDGTSDAVENRLTSLSKDADRDGMKDRFEQKTFRNDHDNDGIKNADDTDDDNDGILDSNETTDDTLNHDNADKKDRKDLDDDNDGIRDYNEASCGEIDDHDNDGVEDDEDSNDDSQPNEPETQEVSIEDSRFQDDDVTIRPGDSVTWTNDDSLTHIVVADDGSFDSGQLDPGQNFTLAFDTAGTYTYHCSIHPDMTGSITVEGDSSDGGDNGDDSEG